MATQLREAASEFQAPPPKAERASRDTGKRIIEGIEIRSDIPFKKIRTSKSGDKWRKLFNAPKVGECAIFPDEKTAKTFQMWGIFHKKRIKYRKVEKGKYAAFKLRAQRSKGGE